MTGIDEVLQLENTLRTIQTANKRATCDAHPTPLGTNLVELG